MGKFVVACWALVTVFGIALIFYATYWEIVFSQNCTGRLKRAADANTIELASSELQDTLTWLEKKDLTEGSTQMVYYTPDCDIAFWYKNLKDSNAELQTIGKDADHLTVSNQLIKLRETLLDGQTVTTPPWISLYPGQIMFFWFSMLEIMGIIVCVVLSIIYVIYYDY